MTEEQARGKWCPQTNGQGTPEENLCIASECMWWLWDEPFSQHKEKGGIYSAHMATDYPDKYIYVENVTGRCGAIK